MVVVNGVKMVFWKMVYDKKIWFLLLASFLISTQTWSSSRYGLWNVVLFSTPFAFSWVVVAWVLTNRSTLRTIWPYATIFLVFFSMKSYGFLILDALSSVGIDDFYANFYVATRFFGSMVFLTTLWYLVRPGDFRKIEKSIDLLKSKRMILVLFMSLILVYPFLAHYFIARFNVTLPSEFFTDLNLINVLVTMLYFLFLGVLITRIGAGVRYFFYVIIAIFSAFPYALFFSIDHMVGLYFFSVHTLSYLLVFLSMLLLSKRRFLEC